MNEEAKQPETIEDLWKTINTIRGQISQAQDEKALLERKAGDILGASGRPELINEEIAAKVRFVRDSYEQLDQIQNQIDRLRREEMDQQAEKERVQAEMSQNEQGDETNVA